MPTFLRQFATVTVALTVLAGLARPAAAAQGHMGASPANKAASRFEHVHALAIDAEGRALWLGAHTGLYRSEDRGRTWQPVALPVAHGHADIMSVVADPKDPLTLYAATHDAGVFKTADGGATWTAINAGLGGLDVHGLAIDPNTPAKLHAAVRGQGEGVYRSTDGGGKWVRVDDSPGGEVKVLASVNIPTGMGGIWLYAGTAEGLQRNPDCF
jgi:photosystem II stability/assembly factor-like uncharacterized protein